MRRRDYLQGTAFSLFTVGLAGCSGKLDEKSTTETEKSVEKSSGSSGDQQETSEKTTEKTTEQTTENPDTDGDGVVDSEDSFPEDSARTADSDGDGVADVDDKFPNDASRSKDSDGDGVADVNDDFPTDGARTTDTDGDGVADIEDQFPDDATRSQLLLQEDDIRKIEEDHWRYYELDCDDECTLDYEFTVRDGPSIDVIVMDKSEYSYFKNGERYRQYSQASSSDSVGNHIHTQLSSGDYYMIFDNSKYGAASPPTNFKNDVATIDFDFTLTK